MMFANQYDNPRLPLWVRLSFYAFDYNGVPLERGQLRSALGVSVQSRHVSRAIRTATDAGVLQPGSSARLLITRTNTKVKASA